MHNPMLDEDDLAASIKRFNLLDLGGAKPRKINPALDSIRELAPTLNADPHCPGRVSVDAMALVSILEDAAAVSKLLKDSR
ncbi:MAG: hypothetical protein MN733_26610 [Nitrososphaera sp.]|nr:hypothetical protein [Nitrososphaera sp.]